MTYQFISKSSQTIPNVLTTKLINVCLTFKTAHGPYIWSWTFTRGFLLHNVGVDE